MFPRLGRMQITILDDDEPGTFQFDRKGHVVKESAGAANLSISRQGGADGEVTLEVTLVVNGGDVGGATDMDYLLHMLTFPFKVLMTTLQCFDLKVFF